MAQVPSVHGYKSVLTLVMFLLANLIVVFPFHISVPIPAFVVYCSRRILFNARILSPVPYTQVSSQADLQKPSRLLIPFDFVTAPLIAVFLLLATRAIGQKEVHDGIIGAGGIKPIDVMALFLSLAYISISLDATGLLRFLAFWVLKKGGSRGRRLYFLLYTFFFVSGLIFGNDPVILSGTAFLAYMTRVAGIVPPTAWVYAQFAVVNISSAVLVSSNPTNLVLAGAFNLSFIIYTANVIVPVVFTAIILFPFLLYLIFPSNTLIPRSIDIGANGHDSEGDGTDLRLALIDKPGAIFGCILLAITLGTLLAISAAGLHVGVYAITVPAAVLMLARDGIHDYTTHSTLRNNARQVARTPDNPGDTVTTVTNIPDDKREVSDDVVLTAPLKLEQDAETSIDASLPYAGRETSGSRARIDNTDTDLRMTTPSHRVQSLGPSPPPSYPPTNGSPTKPMPAYSSLSSRIHVWLQLCADMFPTVVSVIGRLPFSLLPFAFSMFILVQGLSSQGWVELFARWWTAWVHKTGSIGAVAGMGFLSVCLSNFTGTNIGATILLCRVLQLWDGAQKPTIRTRDGAIYALALGANYGAFSASFSASLAGLLWRDILRRKSIHIRRRDFGRLNIPIIAIAMSVGCSMLLGQIHIIKSNSARP